MSDCTIYQSFSKEKLRDKAIDFMIKRRGQPNLWPHIDQKEWNAELGLLMSFCEDLFDME